MRVYDPCAVGKESRFVVVRFAAVQGDLDGSEMIGGKEVGNFGREQVAVGRHVDHQPCAGFLAGFVGKCDDGAHHRFEINQRFAAEKRQRNVAKPWRLRGNEFLDFVHRCLAHSRLVVAFVAIPATKVAIDGGIDGDSQKVVVQVDFLLPLLDAFHFVRFVGHDEPSRFQRFCRFRIVSRRQGFFHAECGGIEKQVFFRVGVVDYAQPRRQRQNRIKSAGFHLRIKLEIYANVVFLTLWWTSTPRDAVRICA